MENIPEIIKIFKYNLKKYSIKISIKNNFINFFIEEIDSIPPMKYEKDYSFENLKNLSKYFLMFDSIEESFTEIKKLINNESYEFNEDNNLIIIYFKTGITNKNFKIEIPIKKIKIEERLEELTQIIKNQQSEINLLKQIQSVQEYNKLLDKCNKLEKLIKFNNENIFKDFNDSILLDYRQKNIIIDKLKDYYFKKQIFVLSLISEGFSQVKGNNNIFTYFFPKYNTKIEEAEKLFSKYDTSRCTILTKLLFRASVNGDNIENYHKYCDNQGSTITIIKTEQDKTFAAFYDKNDERFNQDFNKYIMDKKGTDCLIIFLDAGESIETKYYYDKEIYDENYKKIKNINFDKLIISDSCLSNRYSYIKDPYSQYNEGISNFKVVDYEVFSIYLKFYN